MYYLKLCFHSSSKCISVLTCCNVRHYPPQFGAKVASITRDYLKAWASFGLGMAAVTVIR